MIVVPLVLLFVTAAFDSPMRRVGDGTEYLVMGRNMAMGRPPAAVQGNILSLQAEVATHGDKSWVLDLQPEMLGRDRRFDLTHFWLFPLFAAPGVAVARLFHLHPAVGFTVLNLACLTLLVAVVAKRAGREVAVLVACALL